MKKLGLLAVLLLACSVGAVASNIVTNGGFETGNFSGWTLSSMPACVGVTTGNVLGELNCIPSPVIAPHSGTYEAAFGPYPAQSVSMYQDLTTVAGQEYELTFWLANDPSAGPGTNSFHASWDGTEVLALDNAPYFGWTKEEFRVTASGSTTRLDFTALRNDPSFYELDDVSGTPVPEPGTLMLLGSGLLGLAAAVRRRFL